LRRLASLLLNPGLLGVGLFQRLLSGGFGGFGGGLGQLGGGFAHVQLTRHKVRVQARPVFPHQRDFPLCPGDGGGEGGGFDGDRIDNLLLLLFWQDDDWNLEELIRVKAKARRPKSS
jgi:hypothetical protein